MNIIIEDKLKRHMEENDLKGLVVKLDKCIACGGSYDTVVAKFIEECDDLNLDQYDVIDSEMGEIYLLKEGIKYGETLRFVWKSYYWLDGLGVSGASAATN